MIGLFMNFNKGKVVYWINGQRFENSKEARDGKQKAEQYCLDNFLNPADIQKFDSRTECDRYEYLLELQKQGLISNLGHHFTLRVQDKFINANGDTIPAITYEADFIYTENGKRIVEDVKGSEYFIDERFLTIKEVFDNKMKDKGLYIRVIMYRNKEWVEWHIGEKKKSQKLIKKQREEIKRQNAILHDQEIANNKTQREKQRYLELLELGKNGTITRPQAKRLNELRVILSEKGVII
jgi:hypothetical protein